MLRTGLGWFLTLEHKRIAMIYGILGVWGGFLGLSLSVLIRMTLSKPFFNMMSPEVYNCVVTTHGVVMIFFFLMPVLMGGFGKYLLPLLLGLSDLNLPRVNALSAWLLLPSTVCLAVSLFLGAGVGWTFYPPLSSASFSGLGVDFLMFSLHLAGVSSLLSSLNFICTIFSGMSNGRFTRVSIMIWAYLFTSVLLLASLPVLAAAMTMLLFDRKFSSCFFDPMGGGDPVLFQHMFWFFGHPEVYVLILPGFGMMSHTCSVLSGKDSVFGYVGVIFAMLSIVCLGMVVWGHHMFMVGFDLNTSIFFSSITMVMSVPTGIKVFSWLIMLSSVSGYYGEIAVWWVWGFIFLFTVGGVTGMVLSSSTVDILLHDTWFVVAHFHYVLSLGSYVSIIIFFMGWWPMISGFGLNSLLLRSHFFLSMAGFKFCFFPLHYLGLLGLPRRVCVYDSSFLVVNSLSLLGSCLSAVSGFFFLFILWESLCARRICMGSWGSCAVLCNLISVPLSYHSVHADSGFVWKQSVCMYSLVSILLL